MTDKTNTASTAAKKQTASTSFLPPHMQNSDKWQNFKWG